MGKKIIRYSLDPHSIDKAIKEIEQYKRETIRKMDLLRRLVTERIAEQARSGFASAIVDDLLPNSGGARIANVDVTIDERDNVSLVIANGEDAIWCEFGAGVYHNGSVGTSPHPKGAELGMTIGGYGKGLGAKNVWGFYQDGELKLTHGAPASMPMYNALMSVCADIVDIAREVFN
jgi:hypothetical protein